LNSDITSLLVLKKQRKLKANPLSRNARSVKSIQTCRCGNDSVSSPRPLPVG